MGMVWKEMAQRFWIQAGVSLVAPKEHGLTVTSCLLGDTDPCESGVLWMGEAHLDLTLVFECTESRNQSFAATVAGFSCEAGFRG